MVALKPPGEHGILALRLKFLALLFVALAARSELVVYSHVPLPSDLCVVEPIFAVPVFGKTGLPAARPSKLAHGRQG